MSIFNKAALQGLKKNRARTIVTIIGVILASAMITAVAAFGISLLDYLTRGAMQKYGNWHVQLYDVNSAFLQEMDHDEECTAAAAFQNIGYARLNDGKNPDKPYVFIAGFEDETYDTLPVVLISGRLPKDSSEIVVPYHLSSNGGVELSVGDTITLEVGERMAGNERLNQHDPYISGDEDPAEKEVLLAAVEKTYTVVGICQRPYFEETSAPGYTLITKAEEGQKTDSYSLFVTLQNPDSIHSFVREQDYEYSLNDNVLRFMGLSDNDQLFSVLLYSVGAIVLVIIVVGSVFFIYNAFHISLNERMHQFGILLSVGATEKQLRSSVLFEGLVIGAVGIPIGVFAGLGVMGVVLKIVALNFENILYDSVGLTLKVSTSAIGTAVLLSLATILISAYIPARKAASTPVMECIRQTNEIKVESGDMKTSKLAERIFGLEGLLALKNFKRNKKRYRSVILSLVLSVVLFVSVNAFVRDLSQASEMATIFTTYDIGIDVKNMDDDKMQALYDKLKTAAGVSESSYQAVLQYSGMVEADQFSDAFRKAYPDLDSNSDPVKLSMQVMFLDDDSYMNIIRKLELPEDEYAPSGSSGPRGIALSVMDIDSNREHQLEDFEDMFKEDSMDLTIVPKTDGEEGAEYEKKINLTFVRAVFPDTLPFIAEVSQEPYIFEVLIPWSLKDEFLSRESGAGYIETEDVSEDVLPEKDAGSSDDSFPVAVKGMTFRSQNASESVTDMQKMIVKEGMTEDYTLYNMADMISENMNMIFIANVFGYVFIFMISLIAVANVFNTISTNIKLRRRELAMLRSVGMSEKDFQKMMNFECFFYGMKSLLFGIPISLFSSCVIYYVMSSGGAEDIDFTIPWQSIIISAVGVILVVFFTMLYAAGKIKKENIIDALRDELT